MDNSIEPRLLKIKEAAHYASVGRSTIYANVSQGRLKLTKLGHSSRVERAEMDRWIDLMSVQSAA